MANDSKRTSELNIATSLSANDRLVVLTNPASAAQTQTITVNNFVNSISVSTLKNGNNTISISNTGLLIFPDGVNFGANIEGDASGFDIYAPSTLNYIGMTYGPIPSIGKASYFNYYKEQPGDPNTSSHGLSLQLWTGNSTNTLTDWYWSSNGSFTFPDTTLQYTAFNTNTSYTFSNVISYSNNISFTGANTYIQNKLQIGAAAGYNFGTSAIIEIDASANSYQQIIIQNANAGIQASGDLVITADTGNDSFGYVDLGINSSNYSNATYGITGPLDAYLYSSNSQLVIGTASTYDLVFHAGGTAATNRVLTVNTSGVTVNTSSNLTVLSNTLNLGTSTKAANGYTYLPNGMKMNWGTFICNTTSQVIFTSPFTTAVVSVTVTPANNIYVSANTPYVFASNTSTANIYSASTTTSSNVYYVAIGY